MGAVMPWQPRISGTVHFAEHHQAPLRENAPKT